MSTESSTSPSSAGALEPTRPQRTLAGDLAALRRRIGAAPGSAWAERVPAALAVVVGAWVLIAYSVGQWRSMYVPSWDLAIFSELAKDYAHFQAPIVPIKGDGFNLLGDHFHPMLVLLGPIWRIWPTPLALLITQDLLLAWSAWPITRLASRLLSPIPGALLGIFYALAWGFQGAVAAQFHEIAFAVPLIAFASVAFVEQRWWASALWLLPTVLVKEDLGLMVLMAGLAIALRGWQEKRDGVVVTWEKEPGGPAWWQRLVLRARRLTTLQLGLLLAGTGLVAFLLTVLVILPALSPSGSWQYGLGSSTTGGSTSGSVLSRLLSPEIKRQTLLMLVLTAGVAGLASPWAALALPTIAWRFLASNEFYWDWKNWHYSAVLMPVMVGALLDVVARLKEYREERRPADGGAAPAEPAEQAEPAEGWLAAPVWARWVVALAVVIPLVTAGATAKQLPLWSLTQSGYGATSSRAATADKVIALIPKGSTVETDLGLLAYLVPTTTVSWVGTSATDAQYVVIDEQSSAWGGNPPTDAAQWATQNAKQKSTYTLVLNENGYQVAKKNG